MSEEAQTLCRNNDVGFLDLDGNARLYFDEVFIVKRSLPHKTIPPAAEHCPPAKRPTLRKWHSACRAFLSTGRSSIKGGQSPAALGVSD